MRKQKYSYPSASRTYRAWYDMVRRCTNSAHRGYSRYGGAGITVCKDWLYSFEQFFADMGECPPGKELDRIAVEGNYCKANCRWTTRSQQQLNKKVSPNNTSGYKGVSWCKTKKKWIASASVDGKWKTVGTFNTKEAAITRRKEFENHETDRC